MLVAQAHDTVRDTVLESFVESVDGYFYPTEATEDTALARIYIAPSSYMIERRRVSDAPWLPVVTAECSEFDPAAFRVWRARWPVVAA
jgi:hypothetical protein